MASGEARFEFEQFDSGVYALNHFIKVPWMYISIMSNITDSCITDPILQTKKLSLGEIKQGHKASKEQSLFSDQSSGS